MRCFGPKRGSAKAVGSSGGGDGYGGGGGGLTRALDLRALRLRAVEAMAVSDGGEGARRECGLGEHSGS